MKNISLFGEDEEIKPKKTADKLKRNWGNRFQKWCDNNEFKDMNGYGTCGYGVMCDYCSDNSYGRPCVRALNEMLRETGKTVDYNTATFEDVWNGRI